MVSISVARTSFVQSALRGSRRGKMRVSIDIDNKNPLKLGSTIIKGIFLCRRFPKKIRITRRGFHIVWRGLNIDEKTMYRYRRLLGDDPVRIDLDRSSSKRLKQVLFKEKNVYKYEYDSFGNFERKVRMQ